MWKYSDKVMDHYRNPRNVGRIENADAIGEAGSLACGDSLKIYLKIKDNVVTDAKFQTFGCGSAVASSSVLTEMVIGKTLDEVRKITNKDIADELDGLPQEKMHCSVMGHEALVDALKKYFNEDGSDDVVIEEDTSSKVICTCFNVTEATIKDAILTKKLTTLEEVVNYTKAGAACGRCRGNIQAIIDKYAVKEAPSLSPAQLILKINKVIENVIAPELQKDGGDIELIDIEDNRVFVKLQGRCSMCKNSVLTIKTFVETTLRDKVDNDIEVVQV